jgi:endonuclease YncB( thermonuclease family)
VISSRLFLSALLCAYPLFWTTLVHAHAGRVDSCGCHTESKTGVHHCHLERVADTCDAQPKFTQQRPPKAGDEGVLFGPFVSTIDGDSFKVKVQGAIMDVRMLGIDAPEIDQPFGKEARSILDELIRNQLLVLVFDDVDRYGRIVARAWVADVDINREMISRGAAWFDSEYARDHALYLEEQHARDAKKGLWALPLERRVEPWTWRKKKSLRD